MYFIAADNENDSEILNRKDWTAVKKGVTDSRTTCKFLVVTLGVDEGLYNQLSSDAYSR